MDFDSKEQVFSVLLEHLSLEYVDPEVGLKAAEKLSSEWREGAFSDY